MAIQARRSLPAGRGTSAGGAGLAGCAASVGHAGLTGCVTSVGFWARRRKRAFGTKAFGRGGSDESLMEKSRKCKG